MIRKNAGRCWAAPPALCTPSPTSLVCMPPNRAKEVHGHGPWPPWWPLPKPIPFLWLPYVYDNTRIIPFSPAHLYIPIPHTPTPAHNMPTPNNTTLMYLTGFRPFACALPYSSYFCSLYFFVHYQTELINNSFCKKKSPQFFCLFIFFGIAFHEKEIKLSTN